MGLFDYRRDYGNSDNSNSNDEMYDTVKRNRTSSIVVFAIVIVVYLLYSTYGQTLFGGETTTGRVRLDSSMCNLVYPEGTTCFYEKETDYTTTDVNDEMISFYENTGVQPFLLIVDDEEKLTSDELNAKAEDYYKNTLFNADETKYDEGHMVIAFQIQGDSYAVGYYVGTDAQTVIDADALGTFGSALSECFNKYVGDKIFTNTFKNASSSIMGRAKGTTVIIIVLVAICVLYFAYNIYRTNKQRQKNGDTK